MRRQTMVLVVTMASALGGAGAVLPAAMTPHDVLYPGIALAVETERLRVKTIDPDTKQSVELWFTVNGNTKVKRGEKTVSFTDADIRKDERVVVVVNHDAEKKNVATEIRLAAR